MANLNIKLGKRGGLDAAILLVIVLGAAIAFAVWRVQQTDQTTNPTSQTVVEPNKVSFSFTAAGDFSSGEAAKAVLTGIGQAKTDFTIALGDLGYVGGNEQQWCELVKDRVGQDHPFQLIAGNHDDGGKDGDIRQYSKCLPSRLDNTVGDYGIEYYFDYNDIARFILISPDIQTYGFDYAKGDAHYQWVADTIDDAVANDIKWIFLGMHKNCITPGVKSCEIGKDILNLAIEKGVDVVLQGHEHGYFRSKQLDFNDSCPIIIADEFNQNCVTASGSEFVHGEGTLIVISGAGGYTLRDVDLADEELGYFDTWNAANVGKSFGYSIFDVGTKTLKGRFMPVNQGLFTDEFLISIE